VKLDVKEDSRLDRYLAKELKSSRNQVEQLIKKGAVKIEGKTAKKGGQKIKEGESIEIEFPKTEKSEKKEVDFHIEKVYEDEDLLVINKPSGVVVHPAPSVKEATVVDWLKKEGIRLSTLSGQERQGIVHRLDKETSGLMVIAKNNQSHQALSEQLQDKSMGRYYLALIEPPLKDDMIVERPIARNPKNRLKMGVVEGGRYAKTAFKKIAQSRDLKEELIAAKLFTGRTHQIRVHLASMNRHILGDSLYGFKRQSDKIGRVFLHAYILYLIHPKSKELLYFTALLPEDMERYLKNKFEMESIYEKIEPDNLIELFDNTEWVHYPAKGIKTED